MGGETSEAAERVKALITEHLGVDEEKVTADASFEDALGADSLDMVELLMVFEEEFGIQISDDDAKHIRTVGDAIRYVENAVATA